MRHKKLDPLIHICGAGPRDKHSTVRHRTVVTLAKNPMLSVAKSASTTMLTTTTGSRASATVPVPPLPLDHANRGRRSGATVGRGQPVVAGVVVPG